MRDYVLTETVRHVDFASITPRRRFQRGDLTEALECALFAARRDGRPMYVHATALGWTIERSKPPSKLMPHYQVEATTCRSAPGSTTPDLHHVGIVVARHYELKEVS